MQINIEERKQKAVAYFKEGYNCSQSVVLAYADVFELDEELAKRISAPFGGGMGRLREVCGAVSGMFMLMGFQYPASDPTDKVAKTVNYAAVQRTANEFKTKFGSIICANLLDIKRQPQTAEPSDRNAEYYAKRPCAELVAYAAEIVGKEISNK
jgi:C_GCAxxG_C_C family probable redox protein